MADSTISKLPSASALVNSVVAADNAAGTLTSKVTLGAIAALGGGAPAPHASDHAANGVDPITPASIGAAATNDIRLTDSRVPTSHASSHGVEGTDPLAPSTIGAANLVHTHTVSSITDAGTAASRNVPASGNATSSQVVLGSDSRLTDSRNPTSHASSHRSTGADFPTPVVVSSTLTAGQNDWTPGVADVLYLTATSSVTITGLAASAVDGFAVLLINVGAANNITLAHESASSLAANRFRSAYASSYVLYPDGGSAVLVYHAASSRWRVL